MGLPEDSRLRESLTKNPPEDMRQLIRHIKEYKRLEDDRLQSKGKAPMINRPQQSGFPLRPRGYLTIQEPATQMGEVNVTFKEPVHRIVDRIKYEPYFRWSNKIGGDPSRRNQNLYYTYHQDKGHTTEQCQVLKDHLRKLVKAGYLKEFVLDSGDRGAGQDTRQKGNPLPPPVGVIEFIHAAPKRLITGRRKGVLTVVPMESCLGVQLPEKRIRSAREPIAFNNDDLEGTIQPHDDALVVTTQISGFLVKRVMIDQGNGADVMYPDLFRGLGLKKEDLAKYSTPLVGFDSKVVIPKGQISLPVIIRGKEVVVTFIIVASFSPYTAILGKPWIHSMGVTPSTLYVTIKFPTEQGIAMVRGNQQVARQCLIAIVNWKWENQANRGKQTEQLKGAKEKEHFEQEKVRQKDPSHEVPL